MNAGSRRALLAGVGALAAAGGAFWYARRAGPAADADADDAGQTDLWSQRYPRPEGGELVMAALRGRPLLINFWATWCPPCVKELPEIDRFWQRHGQKLAVVGLAIDSLEPVRAFLQRQPVGFAVGLAGMPGTALARSLGNAQGVLPFTVLLDARGGMLQQKLGETTFAELEGWATRLP
jgi:thiol-disulfide isomerase/thioredoxin